MLVFVVLGEIKWVLVVLLLRSLFAGGGLLFCVLVSWFVCCLIVLIIAFVLFGCIDCDRFYCGFVVSFVVFVG